MASQKCNAVAGLNGRRTPRMGGSRDRSLTWACACPSPERWSAGNENGSDYRSPRENQTERGTGFVLG